MSVFASMAASANVCYFTNSSISLKASTFPSSKKPCCLSLKPVSIISPHGFHAANSCFLGKAPRRHMWPKVTPSSVACIKAAGEVKTADSVPSKLMEKPVKDSTTLRRKRVVRQEKNPKRLNSYSAQRIVLDNYEILKYPLRTEAAVKNISSNNTLVFVVDKRADKKCIRNAAKDLFNIQTRKINTSIAPDGTKKAFLMVVPEQNASELAKKLKIF